MKYILPIILVLLLSSCKQEDPLTTSNVPCSQEQNDHPSAPQLQDLVERYAARGIPGLAIHVTDDSLGSWSGSAGFADIQERIDMTSCTPQYAASIQKTVTAAMILILIDRGELSLSDPVAPFLSDLVQSYLPAVESVTVEHLLLHTSGWKDVFEITFLTDFFNHPDATYTTEEFLRYLKGTKPAGLPRETHYYSDANYLVLTMMLDSLTGDHVRFMETEILAPLGLSRTWYHQGPYPHPEGLSLGYADQYGDGRLENVSEKMNHITSQIMGAGGLMATPGDLSRLIDGLVTGDLLSDDLVNYLLQTAVDNPNEGWTNDQYGPGLMIINDPQTGKWMGHSGSQLGASAFVFTNPVTGQTIAVMTNLGTFFSRQSQQLVFGELWTKLLLTLNN